MYYIKIFDLSPSLAVKAGQERPEIKTIKSIKTKCAIVSQEKRCSDLHPSIDNDREILIFIQNIKVC